MITRRDVLVALVAGGIAIAGMAYAQSGGKAVMHSCVFNWADLKPVPTKAGARRGVFDAPVSAGGIIFEASNEQHGLRNIGTTPAIYYVFKIAPHDMAPAK